MFEIVGIALGLIGGAVWEKLATTPYGNEPTLIQSLIIKVHGENIHIHHFIAYLAIVLTIITVAIKTNRIFHPAVLMILSFLFSAFFYYVWKYTDLHTFLK